MPATDVATGQEPPRARLLTFRVGFAGVAVLLTLVMALSPLLSAAPSGGQERPRVPVIIEPGVRGPSVVLVDRGVDPASVAADNGVPAERVFTTAASAFETTLEEAQVSALANDERVRAIVIDHEIEMAAEVPSGVERIGAPSNPMSTIGSGASLNVGIAILDSGVSSHPDLNVVGGTNCASGSGYADVNGHGTHVAGIAAARDNGSGVVGVAPGARIYAVRVLNSDGRGTISNLICGLEWVAQNGGSIDVVNMSLTGPGTTGGCADHPLHQAVCTVAAAGIPMVGAAGNYGNNAGIYIPALYDEVIAVSSFTDTNGRPGGGGGSCRGTADDFFSSFSNYGAVVDIMAPGGCIYSTIPGGYGTNSGTSMAAPHVAGALALYIANNGRGGAVSWLFANAVPQNSTFGIEGGDSDGSAEPVLYIGDGSVNPNPTPTRQATATPTRSAATATPTRQAGNPTPTATTGVRPPRPGRGTATPTQPASTATRVATATPTRAAGSTATPTRPAGTATRPPRTRVGATAPTVTTATPTRAAGSTATPTRAVSTRPPRTRFTGQAVATATPTTAQDDGAVIRQPRTRGEATAPPTSTPTTVTRSSGAVAPTATQAPAWPTATPTSVLPIATQVPPTATPVPTDMPPTEVPVEDIPAQEAPTEVPTEVPPTEIPTTDVPVEVIPTEVPVEEFPPTEVPVEEVPVEEPTVAEGPTPAPLPVYDVTDTLNQDIAWYAVDANLETAWYLPVPVPTEPVVVEETVVEDVPVEDVPAEEGQPEDGTERQRSSEGTESDVPSAPEVTEAQAPVEQVPVAEPEDLHLTIDLGSEQQIGTVRWLLDDFQYADNMEIQVSLDGETWTTVAWPADVAEWQVLEGEWQEAELYGTTARYVRFMFPNWNGDEVVGGITEVEVIPVPVIVE